MPKLSARQDCKGESERTANPVQTTRFLGRKGGFAEGLLTRDFLYSIVTFLTDAPLAQLDRALDFGLNAQRFCCWEVRWVQKEAVQEVTRHQTENL